MLARIGERAIAWSLRETPWTKRLGAVRTTLALCTASTLVFTSSSHLFLPRGEDASRAVCDGVRGAGLFCIATAQHLELARWVAVLLLLIVASGFRPRLTGVVHWWVSLSLHANATVVDGGDQVAAVLTLLLLPLTLTDSRRWHWDSPPPIEASFGDCVAHFVAHTSLLAARAQVAVIYFHAAVGKFVVSEWLDGTVLYYWFTDPILGAPPWLGPVVQWLVDHGALLAIVTWSVLVIELALAAAIFMDRKYWPPIMAAGFTLHAGILLVHGLFSFAVTMMAALTLYLGAGWLGLGQRQSPETTGRAPIPAPAMGSGMMASQT